MSVKVPPRSIQNCQRRGVTMRSSVRSDVPSPRRTSPGSSVVMSWTGSPSPRARHRRTAACWCTRGRSRATSGRRATQAPRGRDRRLRAPRRGRARRDRRGWCARNARVERQPFDRRVGARADRGEVLGRERRRIDGDDADAAAVSAIRPRSSATSSRLEVHTGTVERGRHLALKQGEEAAARRHRGGAFAHERARRVDERRQQRGSRSTHDAPRRRAATPR